MRLVDIDVEEVSLVDTPANLEKFLVVKRAAPAGESVLSDEQIAALTVQLKELRNELGK